MPAEVKKKKKSGAAAHKKPKARRTDPPEKFSDDPKHIRGRIRRAGVNMQAVHRDIEMLYGRPVEEWDFEELQHGCPRKPNGKFPRHKPAWLTPIIMAEAQRRLRMMSQSELGLYAGLAIKTMADLMMQTKSHQTRFAAAQYILNQIIGTPKAHVEVSGSIELRTLLAECIVNPDGVDAHPIEIGEAYIDAEVIDDDEAGNDD